MELFPPLSEFYASAADDPRIGSTHISLYMALLQQWNVGGGINPFFIERLPVMRLAKISARHTYNKCLTDLHTFGYLVYTPALNASVRSSICLTLAK